MKYRITPSTQFKKDLERATRRGYPLQALRMVVDALARGEQLPPKYRDHALVGDYVSYRECHIKPDWLLVYRYHEDELQLLLYRTGTHSDLF